jgi:hypothetical protein
MGNTSETAADLFPAYIVSHEAWYSGALADRRQSITVQHASTGGGVAWEFAIEQVGTIGAQVQIFDDAWQAFVEFPALFVGLAELGQGASLSEICDLLHAQGFRDITERTRVPA